MLFVEILKMALDSFRLNKLRTFLTALGIMIGVAAVVALMALGEGTKASIERQFTSLGSNLLIVNSGSRPRGAGLVRFGPSRSTLTNKDYESLIKGLDKDSVVTIVPESSRNVQVKYLSVNANVNVIGTSPDYVVMRDWGIKEGSFFTTKEYSNKKRVAVLGSSIAETLFGNDSPIGKKIKVNGMSFQVIGIMKPQGQAGGFMNMDELIFIPLSTYQRKIEGGDRIRTIYVSVKDISLMDKTQAQIEEIIRKNHKITNPDDDDFNVQNQAAFISAVSSATQTMTMFLAGIAAISLLVGGIGIMNIMLVNVTERIREIGIRKAIGAKARDILMQFLMESMLVSVAGGLIGIIIGIILGIFISKTVNISMKVTPTPIFLSFSVSAIVGIFFGYYPAKRAAGLNPIEALRYE
ncbi:MAG: ABC transporter permease [bacterium]|nr:ABC transporter permease [bacterium]